MKNTGTKIFSQLNKVQKYNSMNRKFNKFRERM